MDVGLFFTTEGIVDIRLANRDLEARRDLETAIIISIWTNRRANDDDRLPDDSGYLAGWWGDTYADAEDDQIGSRLWLLSRETRTEQTLNRAKQYLQEAVQWIIDDGIATRVNVHVEYDTNRLDTMLFAIDIYRPDGRETFTYDFVWQQFDSLTKTEQAELDAITSNSFLLTEDGDTLTTEDGDGLLLEDES